MSQSSAMATYRLRVASLSDVGLKRSENQDYVVVHRPDSDEALASRGVLLLVADGMGGARGGATASRIAGDTVRTAYYASSAATVAEALAAAVTEANAAILAEATANSELRGMGTTLSALVLHGEQAWLAHIGDSRIYLLRAGELTQLTKDSTLVAAMVAEGLITEEQAQHHPQRNVLQRSLGVRPTVEIDALEEPLAVAHGDLFLICSDGLHGLVAGEAIRETVQRSIPGRACETLVDLAKRGGGHDNISVVVARCEPLTGSDTEAESAPAGGGHTALLWTLAITGAIALTAMLWLLFAREEPRPPAEPARRAPASAAAERVALLRERASRRLTEIEALLAQPVPTPSTALDSERRRTLEAARESLRNLTAALGPASTAASLDDAEVRLAAIEAQLAGPPLLVGVSEP